MAATRISVSNLVPVIEPDKSIVEDLEVIAFEDERQLDLYSIWHETLFDKRRELNAETERERAIIRNEIAKKTSQYQLGSYTSSIGGSGGSGDKSTSNKNAIAKASSKKPVVVQSDTKSTRVRDRRSSAAATKAPVANLKEQQQQHQHEESVPWTPNSRTSAPKAPTLRTQPQKLSPSKASVSSAIASSRPRAQPSKPELANGLVILNSEHYKTLPAGKQMLRYKLTKLYNKLRGRQMRRNFVLDRQKAARIEAAVSKSFLNHWGAYTALQAIYVPDFGMSQLSTIAIRNNPKLFTIPQARVDQMANAVSSPAPAKIVSKSKSKKPTKREVEQQQQQQQQHQAQQALQSSVANQMQFVYFDSNDIITYSNRINPQQVAAYRARSHLLPSSANSKRSSAASYDVYEIMEVLVNTNKTNVTITRNANKPAPKGGHSIYSHSVNANTPGIASTQLHHQARTYLDSVSKFYAEERELIAQEEERLRNLPPIEEQVAKYFKIQ